MTASQAVGRQVPEEDRLRADLYGLLAKLLANAPSRDFLKTLSGLEGDDSELGRAFAALADVARACDPSVVAQEYHDLFIGVGRGELVPFGSYYLTGFLHEKPLAKLRVDMSELGIARSPDASDPEDHIAAVCDMMAGLIDGRFGEPQPLATQKAFFETHLGSWAPHFFKDLEAAEASVLYATLGTVGRLFMDIEAVGFTMDV